MLDSNDYGPGANAPGGEGGRAAPQDDSGRPGPAAAAFGGPETVEPDAVTVPLQPARVPRGSGSGGSGPSVRLGIVAGIAALVVAGTAIMMAAAPSTAPATSSDGLVAAASAAPTPTASDAPGDGRGPGRLFGPGMGPMRDGGMFGKGLGPGMMGRGDNGWQYGGMGGGRMRGPFGTITIAAIDGSSVSLKTADGWTRTITLTDSTTLTKAGDTITRADLAVGDTVRFSQTRNSDGTFTITALEVVVPQAGGNVTGLTSGGFTFTGRDGLAHNVTVTGSTKFTVGAKDGTKADVTVGANVIVAGPTASDGTITALHVTVVLPRVTGQVSATASNTLTITRMGGTALTIHVGADTTYRVAGASTATFSDIKTGMFVIVEGTQRSDGSLDAVTVVAGDVGTRRGFDRTPAEPSPSPSATGTSG